ncbi:tetracycline resistance protein [Clostridia bacterium]|nr:tetracycline resistance protein [Clostridia bacterium]
MTYINTGFLAHVDAGKTSTVERVLHLCGAVKSPGSIKGKNTTTDFLEIERERGISVKSSGVSVTYNDVTINMLDTPGHADFAGEVERAVMALSCAVIVISAAERVQSGTEIIWKALTEANLPVIIFVNKIDRAGVDITALNAEIAEFLTPRIVPLNRAVNAGEKDVSVTELSLSDEETLLKLSDFDDDIAEAFLSGEQIPADKVTASLRKLTLTRAAFPLIYGSAALGLGIDTLLSAITAFFPSEGGEASVSLPISGIIYKIEHSKQMGKTAHARLYSGTISNRDVVKLSGDLDESEPRLEKVTQIRRVSGGRYEDAGVLHAGEIAAIYGLTSAKIGDFLGERQSRRNYSIANPLFSVALTIEPAKISELLAAVTELSEEDPLLSYAWHEDERELSVKVTGEIQIETLAYFLRERYNLSPTFERAKIIYKETPAQTARGFEAYTMPKPCWAILELEISPAPRGSGLTYKSIVPDRELLTRYQNHIKINVPMSLKQGRLGYEVTDLSVTLVSGNHHLIHTHPMDFFLATPIAVQDALKNAGETPLEPILSVRLRAEQDLAGKLIGDIINMRGEYDNPVIANGKVTIEALLPAAECADYPVAFASLTNGKGMYKAEFAGYAVCPPQKFTPAPIRGVDPLDRAKWILTMRRAL